MKIFDNYDKELKELNTDNPTIYVCGPTVYNYIHIGNARPMIVFDVLYRVLKRLSDDVTYISNFTDVDDKIINKALADNLKETEVSEKYIDAYQKDRESLNVLKPTHQPKVTENIEGIIKFIDSLVNDGYAYAVDGDVFFSSSKIKDYGKLSNKIIDELVANAEVTGSEKKKESTDFVLWKKTNDGIKWNSPWGKGRPGWHTECVVMIEDIAKKKIDLHGGGVDLKFPHHENEIAQSIAANGHNLANIWAHNGHISIDGEKMSKSLGNFILVKDILTKVNANVLRLLMLKSSYSSPINFSDELVETSTKEWTKVENAVKQASVALQLNSHKLPVVDFKTESTLVNKLVKELRTNLNTPNAITEIIALTKLLNNQTRQKDFKNLSETFKAMQIALLLMGLNIELAQIGSEEIELFNKWNQFKKDKDWDNADKIRKQLTNKGIL